MLQACVERRLVAEVQPSPLPSGKVAGVCAVALTFAVRVNVRMLSKYQIWAGYLLAPVIVEYVPVASMIPLPLAYPHEQVAHLLGHHVNSSPTLWASA